MDVVKIPYSKSDDSMIPQYAYPTDAGCDLSSIEEVTLFPGRPCKRINTGVKIAIPEGYFGLVLPRSGVSIRTTMRVVPGVIDSGYRGSISVMAENVAVEKIRPTMPMIDDSCLIKIEPGDRIAQLLILPVAHAEFEYVENFDEIESERKDNGFGSTGLH